MEDKYEEITQDVVQKDKEIENKKEGTSLVIQWLRIHLATQGTPVPSLVGELRSHMPRGN